MTAQIQLEKASEEPILHARRRGDGLVDGNGRFTCEPGERSITFEGELEAGYYVMRMMTAAGTFAVDTLMLPLLEWPSMETVHSGPFDFDHTENRMVVPTFRVFVNDEDAGLVWCEIPSTEDLEAKRIQAQWGIHVEQSGPVRLRLQPPAEETRLDWSDLTEVTLAVDSRTPRPTQPAGGSNARPRLFIDSDLLARLRDNPDDTQKAMLKALEEDLALGSDSTYGHRTAALALAGLVTGKQAYIREAIDRAMATCDREVWGFHNVPEIMGWNNDRDTGMRLFEAATVYDWLHSHLSQPQRDRLGERLGHFTDLLNRMMVVQRGYWYTKSRGAHGLGVWFGFISAAIALLDDDPRAQGWLDWSHGNMLDALNYAPRDGFIGGTTGGPIFNILWLVLSVMALERYTGQKLDADDSPLRGIMTNLMKLENVPGAGMQPQRVTPMLLCFLADRHQSAQAQAVALRQLKDRIQSHDNRKQALHLLNLLAYRPDRPTQEPKTQPLLAHRSANGSVICASADGKVSFTFRSGSTLSAEKHDLHEWQAQASYKSQHSGSFGLSLNGRAIVPEMIKSYRSMTGHANIISIDGGGHRQHGRWLGSRTPLEHTSRITRFEPKPDHTLCVSEHQMSYLEACDVRRLERRWAFFHGSGLIVFHDRVEMDQPHHPAWNMHSVAMWERVNDQTCRTTVGGESLDVRRWVVQPTEDPEAIDTTLRRTHFVPTYTMGLNRYKSGEWQPELNAERQPPDFGELVIQPHEPTRRFEIISILGADPQAVADCEVMSKDKGRIVRLPGESLEVVCSDQRFEVTARAGEPAS